jgi:hypothetical protein
VATVEVKRRLQDLLPIGRPDPVVTIRVDYHIDTGNAYDSITTSFDSQASRVSGQCTQFGFVPLGCLRLESQQSPSWEELGLDPALSFSPWDWVTVTASTSATVDESELQDVRHFAWQPDPDEPQWVPFEPKAEDEIARTRHNRLSISALGLGDPPRLATCTCDASSPPFSARLPFARRTELDTEVALAIDQLGSDSNGDGEIDVVAVEIEDFSGSLVDKVEIDGGSFEGQFYLRGPGTRGTNANGAAGTLNCLQFGTADQSQGRCDGNWCSIIPNNSAFVEEFDPERCLQDVDADCDGQGKATFHLGATTGVNGILLSGRQLIEVEGSTYCTN